MRSRRRSLLGSGPDAPSATAADPGGETPDEPGADQNRDALDTEALRLLAAEIARDFTVEFGRTALVIYDIDPAHLQAQWNLASEDVAHALGLFSEEPADLRQILRLCRLEPNGQSQVVAASCQGKGSAPSRGQEGFRLPDNDAAYECELGLESADGGWLLLARSNRIRLSAPVFPAAGPGASDAQAQTGKQPRNLADQTPKVPVEAALAAVGEPLDPYFPNPGPVIDPASARRSSLKGESARDAPREQALRTPRDPIPESTPWNGGEYADSPSRAMGSMSGSRLPSAPDSGMQAGVMPGPLYAPGDALSSAALRGVAPRREDLKVQAELVVHGAGRPGARLELFGLPVRVDADGRFAVRRTVDAALLLSLALGQPSAPVPGDPDAE